MPPAGLRPYAGTDQARSDKGGGRQTLTRLLAYWHTARHLKPVQIYGRLWFRLYVPKPDTRPAPAQRKREGHWLQPTERASVMTGPDAFRFLNVDGDVVSAEDWNAPGRLKLWLYNLHYFDDLTAFGAPEREGWHRALIGRWIEENPPGRGNGWEPYPLSRRIVNWIAWANADQELEPSWLDSLAIQARCLAGRIEWHLLGNHLLANAKALIFAGTFFEGKEADAWLAKGLDILAREIPEQILADGGHFERSPMYHATVLEDFLDLINLAQSYPCTHATTTVANWRRTARQMVQWLKAVVHPDGEISFFNDAAFSVSPTLSDLQDYAMRLGLKQGASPGNGVSHLTQSGYLRVQGDESFALLDVGPVGPDYLPGHAHADTLSFELSLFDQRVIVNSGTSQYAVGPERARQRATAAHSTLEIDELSSSETWGSFRVARRARPLDLHITDGPEAISISCAHDGYRRLPGRAVHSRHWQFGKRSVCISDEITGQWRCAIARFHLHPDVAVEGGDRDGLLTLKDGRRITWRVDPGGVQIVPGTWHPEFGLSIPNHCLELLLSEPTARLTLEW